MIESVTVLYYPADNTLDKKDRVLHATKVASWPVSESEKAEDYFVTMCLEYLYPNWEFPFNNYSRIKTTTTETLRENHYCRFVDGGYAVLLNTTESE